jgi:hypothetical protein
MSVQIFLFFACANGCVMGASFAHAAPRFGNVPPTGAQRSVYVFLPGRPCPSGQIVMLSDVGAASTRIAARMLTVPG